MLKIICRQCGFVNEHDWNFCQVCRAELRPQVSGRNASSFSFPQLSRKQILIISLAGFLGVVVFAVIGAWIVQSEQKREAALAVSYDERIQVARARLAEGDVPGAEAALADALEFRTLNAKRLRAVSAAPAELMLQECKAVLSSDALRKMVAAMSESEFKAYAKDGTLPEKPYYKTPEVEAYARKFLTQSREKALVVRRDIEIAKREADKAEAARQREGQIAAERERLRKDPLEVVSARWERSGFGTVGIWRVTFRNKSEFRVGNISYETTYYAETGAEVGSGDGVLQKVIEPRATRTLEINDGFIHSEAHRASFTLVSAQVLN